MESVGATTTDSNPYLHRSKEVNWALENIAMDSHQSRGECRGDENSDEKQTDEAGDVKDASKPSVDETTNEATAPITRRRRRRNASSSPEKYDRDRLQAFEQQAHSLRISASNVAAMAGYHPYKNLPELLMQLVYQGSTGQALLQADAELLGLKLVSSDQVLHELATKAGAQAALQEALQVKQGTKVLPTVQEATKVKDKVIQQAKKVLNRTELKILQEGVRSAVDTGYGVAHEDDALNLYEHKCGWTVRERNAEIRAWPFGRSEDAKDWQGELIAQKTALPLGKAEALRKAVVRETVTKEDPKRRKTGKVETSDSDVDLNVRRSEERMEKVQTEGTPGPPPYFCILGSVDGIRDELVPTLKVAGDDDSWILQQVIVECKHRMKAIRKAPPLYEMIQTCVYMLMYEVDSADLVQVLRRSEPKTGKRKPEAKEEKGSSDNGTLDSWIVRGDDKRGEQPSTQGVVNEPKKPPMPKPIISFTRISLDDPVSRHRSSWESIVLPRLRSFVDAVYTIRSRPDHRYRLLASASDPTGDMEQGWLLLHELCPWMAECDTAFYQRQ